MEQQVRSFEDLECWKLCTEIRKDLMELLKKYPPHEKFGLTDNTRRASRSVITARGSLFELIDQMITAHDEKYINDDELATMRKKNENALRVLNGYINYLDRKSKEDKD